MIYPYEDNELIYLIKEGSNEARDLFYYKYYEITRALKFVSKVNFLANEDIVQECMMFLWKALDVYDQSLDTSFCYYYIFCIKRIVNRINFSPKKRFYENNALYITDEIAQPTDNRRKYINLLKLSFEKEDDLTKLILNEYIINNFSIIYICKKYNLNYTNLYRKIKKVQLMAQKIID